MRPIDGPSSCFALAPQAIYGQQIKCSADQCCTSSERFDTRKLKRKLNFCATSPLSPSHKDQLQKWLELSVDQKTEGYHLAITQLLVTKH
jgi:hypothetical protein